MDKNRVTLESSLAAAIENAKKFGASVDEARHIHEVVSQNTTPEARIFEVKYGFDSEDQLAVWINLIVDKDYPVEKIGDLTRVATKIRSELLKDHIRYWPYVGIRAG